MRKPFFLLVVLLVSKSITAQTPTSCFEIESILVDACANPEGANEMVRLRTGPNALTISDLSIQWPNLMNPWLGTCQDAATATKVDSINQTIQGCGILIEPTGGLLPAGSQVLLMTSTEIQALAHSFVNLNDTLYVIFQCDSNTAGHFANDGAGIRTLIMSFSQPAGCSDTVSYDRALLINIYDSTGGTTASQNGSSVAYEWNGTPHYYNNGCVAPFIPVSVDAGNDTSVCEGSLFQLNGSEQSANAILWKSGQGTFSSASILNPVFTPFQNEPYPILITLTAYTPCDSIIDTLYVSKHSASISAGSDLFICAGESAQLNASGGNSYSWSESGNIFSNQPDPVVSPAFTTTYFLTGNDNTYNCPASDSVVVTVNLKDSLIITTDTDQICPGQAVSASVTGGGSYIWFPDDGNISDINSPSPTLTPQATTTYFVASTGSCADTASSTITVLQKDSITVSADPIPICSGDTAQLLVSGANGYTWSPDDGTLSNINIPDPLAYPANTAVYTVTSSGVCPDTMTIQVDVITPATLIVTPQSADLCFGDSIQLNVSGSNYVIWNPSAGLSCTECADPVAKPGSTITYVVTDMQCYVQDSVTITEIPLPEITISDDTIIMIGESAALSAGGGSSYSWQPASTLNVSDAPSVIATPSETTVYTVDISENQCSAQATVTVIVLQKECPSPVIPSAFTPNGDEKNDLFGLINSFNYASAELRIFNRWGENVFRSINFEKWDGFYNGDLQPVGTFVYVLNATCPDQKTISTKGSVSLIR